MNDKTEDQGEITNDQIEAALKRDILNASPGECRCLAVRAFSEFVQTIRPTAFTATVTE